MYHLFLTGDKQIGKSTLIQKLLADFSGELSGFFTRRLQSSADGLYYTHLLRPNESPCEENILFCCNDKNRFDSGKRFETLGLRALFNAEKGAWIVMDELGPHEETAVLFQERVFELLNGSVPILGVLQKADSPFLEKISSHPSVRVVCVTKENRDSLFSELLLLKNELFSLQ